MRIQSALMLSALPFQEGHVIFDEVGSLAGAVSYVHLAINVDFSSIRKASADAELALENYNQRILPLILKENRDREQMNHTHHQLMSNRKTKLHRLQTRLHDIERALPRPLREARDVKDYLDGAKIAKSALANSELTRSAINALGISASISNILTHGIFGNFLSIFSPLQLSTIRLGFNKMIQCFTNHDEFLADNRRVYQDLENSSRYQILMQTLASESNFNLAFDAIDSSLDDVASAMQEAQNQRLAIELVPVGELQRLYNILQQEAQRTSTELLITSPSHLFQVETSFLYDGDNAALLIHVPMIPPGTLSTLYKLRPFPIPIQDGNVLMPKETPELLAISNHQADRWNIIMQYSLASCSKINSIHVCPGQGILRQDTESTCLGALHRENLARAEELCDMDILPEHELAIPLQAETYLLYALSAHTGTLQCPGKKLTSLALPKGISQQHIPEGCQLEMSKTTVYSQFNLRLPASVKYYQWHTEAAQQLTFSTEDISATREALARTSRGAITLSDVRKQRRRWAQHRELRTLAIFAAAATIGGLALFVFMAVVIYRYVQSIRNSEQKVDLEQGKLKDYIDAKFRRISQTSIRIRAPTPPGSEPTSPTPTPLTSTQDPTHADLHFRLHELRDEKMN